MHKYKIELPDLSAKAILGLTLFTLILPLPVTIHAQSNDETLEEVVVTGSNIRRRGDYENPNPIQTVGQLEIANTGAVRIQDIFKGITANSGSQLANRQNFLQGVSQFSLRGLGIGSTLTLINGRRAGLAPVSDSSGAFFTDVNAYPINMIERVEILTDGASATYGSEAVAGVVNIITRKDFEGFEIGGEFRDSTHKSYQLNAAVGSAFEKGRFSTFVNFYSQDGNYRGDIDIIREADSANMDGIGAVFSSGTAAPDRIDRAEEVPGMTGSWRRVAGTTINDTCVDPSRGSSNCRYPFINQRRIIAEEDRFQIFSQFDYDVTSKLSIDSEISFSRNEIRDAIGGAVLRTNTHNGGFLVRANNPYNYVVSDASVTAGIRLATPAEIALINDGDASAPDTVDVIVRQRPLGARFDGDNAADIETVFRNLRFSSGIDYELDNLGILNLNYTYSDHSFTRAQPRDYSADLYQQAIDDHRWNPFATSILNPNGVGKDGTSTFGNSSEDLALFALIGNTNGEITQQVAEAIMSGETNISLPGGTAAYAVGGQYREIAYEFTPDSRIQQGIDGRGTVVEAIPRTKQDVGAVFVEFDLPVLDRLETQLALRYENYGGNTGNTTDPKLSLKFDLNDSIALRSSIGTSFQAPTIQQQFGATGSAGIADPGNGELFNVDVIVGGSDNLTPQEATNYNIGLIFQTAANIQISVDFWSYDYSDLIGPRGGDPEAIVQAIYNANVNDITGTPTFAQLAAAADMGSHSSLPGISYTRDGTSSVASDGMSVDFAQLDSVSSEFTNLGSVDVSGFDITAIYSLGDFFANFGEDLVLNASTTIYTEFESDTFSGLDGKGDLKGSRNFNNALGSTPDFKINGGVTYYQGNHLANVSVRHIAEYTDDQSRRSIDSQTTVDLRYSLLIPGIFNDGNISVSAGIVNVFDEDPPRIQSRPLFDTEVHDVRGRQYYLTFVYGF